MRKIFRELIRFLLGENLFVSFRGLYWSVKLRLAEYEPETQALPLLIPRRGVCIDVGSNFGQFAGFLSRSAGPQGRVYCFEPLPYNRRVFDAVMRHMDWPNVELQPDAVGDKVGKVFVQVPGSNTAETFLAGEGVPTEMTTLDRWFAQRSLERIDFIKIDVEGSELLVLEGAREAIKRFRPIILCEVTGACRRYGLTPEDTFQFLRDFRYDAYIWRAGQMIPVNGVREGASNYFFIHSSRGALVRNAFPPDDPLT